jgi:protocatechuate 3,4-dioxygenase alpha subunit
MADLTPFQPVGPYFHVMLRGEPPGLTSLVAGATRGTRIVIEGAVLDGSGAPLTDGLVEIWQADADGRYHHPDDRAPGRADEAFGGYGRVATDDRGRFRFETIRPGQVQGPGGRVQAPHVLVSLLAPGVLTRYWTRLYFDDEPSNATDPVLQHVPPERRGTLLARASGDGRFRFDIVLQGPGETVFFDA